MATPIRIKRSAVSGKKPQNTDLQVGELALNTYDGSLFTKRDTGGVGIATTVSNITPWVENFGGTSINYSSGNVGIGSDNPTSKLDINGSLNVSGVSTLGSGASAQVFLQYGGSTKLKTQSWGVQATGTIQAIGGRLENANVNSQTEGYSIKLLNSDGAGGAKDLIEIGHTSNNSFITGHVGNININAPTVAISTNMTVGGIVTATSFESTVSTGTAPFVVASTTKVTNLNADLLDGRDTSNTGGNEVVMVTNASGGTSLGSGSFTAGNVTFGNIVGTALSVSGISTFNGGVGIADSIFNIEHTNTAIRFLTEEVAIETAGTERLRITGIGSVGIGTNNPQAKLDIFKAYNGLGPGNAAARIYGTDSNVEETGIRFVEKGSNLHTQPDAYLMRGISNGTTRFVFGANGKVGIGTTNPSQELTVYGNNPIISVQEASASSQVDIGTGTVQGFVNIQKADGTRTVQISSDGDTYFIGGSVGIGTNDPIRPLHIHAADCRIRLEDAGIATDVELQNDSGDAVLTTNGASNLRLQTNNLERLRITSDGKVGIGTNNPNSLLSLYSDAADEELLHFDMGSPTQRRGWKFKQGSTGTGTQLILQADENGKVFQIQNSSDDEQFYLYTGNTGSYLRLAGELHISDTILHTGDQDTKIRFPAENTISFETAGSERVRIDSSGNLKVTGIATFDQNVSIGGTLTYEDVTNIDSVGIVTAQTGIKVLAGGINAVGVVTGTSFESTVSTGTAPFVVASTTKVTNLNADLLDGKSTANGAAGNTVVIRNAAAGFSAADVNFQSIVGTALSVTGIATATSFSGSGASLTGLTGASSGTYGNSTNTPVITVDGNGRITTISTASISGGGGGGGGSIAGINTTGTSVFNTLDIGGDIDVDGHTELDNLNVAGVSTFTGKIIANSNIGIGTDDPGALLNVYGTDSRIRLSKSNAGTDLKHWDIAAQGENLRIQAKNDAGAGGGNLFDFYRSTNQVNEFLGMRSGNYWFVVDNLNAKVGIGLTDPDSIFHVRPLDESNFLIRNEGSIIVLASETNNGRDSNRGMDFEASAYRFIQGGVEKFRIDSNGRIFTGGSTQLLDSTVGALHISGGTSGGRLAFRGTTTSAEASLAEIFGFWDTNKIAGMIVKSGTDTTNKDDGSLHFYTRPDTATGIVERLSIISDGKVGIGTVSPDHQLHVVQKSTSTYGDGVARFEYYDTDDGGGDQHYDARFIPTGTYIKTFVTGGGTDFLIVDADNVAGRHSFAVEGDGGSNKSLTVDCTGLVGIGTDSPESLLHLQGTGGTTSGLRIKNSVGKNVSFYMNNDTSTSAFSINYGGTGGSDIQIGNTGNVVLAPSGNALVGVGTYAPTAMLDVKGDARITGILTVGESSLKLDGDNNIVNVGTALTLGHDQGIQFHTQNLHASGFEVNQINATGIITANTFKGALTGNATGLSGTPSITVQDITAEMVSIGGTLTYEDVTNIDSVGIITAQTGIKVLAGGINAVGVVTTGTLEVKGDTNPNAVFDRGSANTTNVNFKYNGTLTGQLGAADADFQISAVGATTPISFYTNGDEALEINDDQDIILKRASIGAIHRSDTAGAVFIAGGNNTDVGGNINLFGSTHASLANHIRFRNGGTVALEIDQDGKIGFNEDNPSKQFSYAYTQSANYSSTNAVYEFLLWNKADISSYATCGASIQLRAGNTSAGGGNITGVRRGGSNQGDLAFSTTDVNGNPVEKLRITSAGNVGIGSEIPSEKLDVAGHIKVDGGPVLETSATYNPGGALKITSPSGVVEVGAQNTSYAHFITNIGRFYFGSKIIVDEGIVGSYNEDLVLMTNVDDERIRIKNDNGHVGIGITNPAYTLDLGESSSTIRLVSENDGTAIRVGAGGNSSDVTLIRVDGASANHDGESDDSANGFSFKYLGSGAGVNNRFSICPDNQAGTQFEGVTVLQDGKVGIGTAAPDEALHIRSGSPVIKFSDGALNSFIKGDGSDLKFISGGTTKDFMFQSSILSSSEVVRITGDGKVGIGTNDPTATLDVDGSLDVSGNIKTSGNHILLSHGFTSAGITTIGDYYYDKLIINSVLKASLKADYDAGIHIGESGFPFGDGYFKGNITGFNRITAGIGSTHVNLTVTVATKHTDHRYHGSGSSNAYVIDGVQSPFFTFTPGRKYRFDQSHNTNSGHPLRFFLEADKTTPYTTNVTTNGTPGSSGAYTEIEVTDQTPTVLHYQCNTGGHNYMGNALQTNSNVVNTNYPAHLRDVLSVTGVSTFSSVINANNGINLTDSDNKSILLGEHEDMRIRHTGSNSEITDEGTGSLRLGGNSVVIGSATFSENNAVFTQGAGVSLGYTGNTKLATTNTGVVVTGILTATSFVKSGGTSSQYLMADGSVTTSGGGGGGVTVQDEGSALSTTGTTLNFVGNGVVASGTGATKTITISGGGSGITVQDEGSALSTLGTTLNFVGSGVVASGTGATKTITISGGGGGTGGKFVENATGIHTLGNVGVGTTNASGAILNISTGAGVTDTVALDIQGTEGSLFSVTNNLTSGSLFSINDVSGIPAFDYNANGKISMGAFADTVAIGKTSSGVKLGVKGSITEGVHIVANKVSAASTINVDNGNVHLFTTNETTTATPNITSTVGLNTSMDTGDTLTVVIISKPNNAGYYAELTIDGVAQTEEWLGGSAPSSASSDGYDVNTYNIIKTGSATYIVLANTVNFSN